MADDHRMRKAAPRKPLRGVAVICYCLRNKLKSCAFGGPALDRLFVTSIAFDLGEGITPPPEAAWLVAVDDVGAVGRPEFRFSLG